MGGRRIPSRRFRPPFECEVTFSDNSMDDDVIILKKDQVRIVTKYKADEFWRN